MFGKVIGLFGNIKQDLLILTIAVVSVYGAFSYVKGLNQAIADKENIINDLIAESVNKDQVIARLELVNSDLVNKARMGEDICEIRISSLQETFKKETEAKTVSTSKKNDKNNRISTIKRDTNKSESQKELEILNAEYDAMIDSKLLTTKE